MVNPIEKRDFPTYSLDLVRSLAAEGQVLASREAQRDYENLGYGPDEVNECLSSLDAEPDFDCSIRYDEDGPWLDVYMVRRTSPTGQMDDLYIKFELTKNRNWIRLKSFHRERDI